MEAPLSLLEDYDREYPGLVDFYSRMLGYYFGACPRQNPAVAERMSQALEELGQDVCVRALGEFQEAGIFESEGISGDQQVMLFWTSPLMHVYSSAIGYAPGPEVDLEQHLPDPVASITELLERRAASADRVRAGELARGDYPYWKAALQASAPELYLLPFLGSRSPLVGLDLGCGWGRATLSLRRQQLDRVRMRCIDLGQEELSLFTRLAQNNGCAERIETIEGDVCRMPFNDDEFDFGLSFVLLDLLSDLALQSCLEETLRCLKANSPFYVEVPTQGCCRQMMLQGFTDESFCQRLHGFRVLRFSIV